MAANRDTSAARAFHTATKYTLVNQGQADEDILAGTPPNLEASIWQEDWSIEPRPFKSYTTADSLDLPREFAPFALPILDAIADPGPRQSSAMPDLDKLARICLLSNGILTVEHLYAARRRTGIRVDLPSGTRSALNDDSR